MDTELLVIGAGPYALSVAAFAKENGIETTTLGRPMAFWREHMPAGMFLRSGPDWHLDAAGVHTLEAYLEERGIAAADADPIPIGLFLGYVDWFRKAKGVEPKEDLVAGLAKPDGKYEATLESGARVVADAVVCAPGIRHFANLPEWASDLPPERADHTCDLVTFDDLAGERVLIVGGRQSAYEWAALIREHGAGRIDIVHRHEVPRFERVSWRFIDPHVERTLSVPGYWRRLPEAEQEAIARRFWEVGRLTLEAWLTPRLDWEGIHRWPSSEVVETATTDGAVTVRLSNSESLEVDRVVFASGYRAQLDRVPYLQDVVGEIELADGFPVLDESLGTSLRGLYLTGFSATRDFGPFFGFVKAAPASATLIVRDLLSRN
jgi:cation diffusion facilitator CzcD-associated flavoprotein CzcO